jgi:hypothetical protein
MAYAWSFEQHGRYYGDFESIEEALEEAKEEAASYLQDKPTYALSANRLNFSPKLMLIILSTN